MVKPRLPFRCSKRARITLTLSTRVATARVDARYPVLRLVQINAREDVREAVLQDVLQGVPPHVSKTVLINAPRGTARRRVPVDARPLVLGAVREDAPVAVLMRVSLAPHLVSVAVSLPV